MGLFGGILGGVIGATFAGPWGAAIGAVIGYNVHGAGKPSQKEIEEAEAMSARAHQAVLTHIFRALAKIAKSDGVVSQEEAAMVSELLREFCGDDAALRSQMKAEFDRAKSSGPAFGDEVRSLAALLTDEAKNSVLEMFCTLARVDGRVSAVEIALLREAEAILDRHGFVDRFFNASGSGNSHRPESASDDFPLNECYRILGIAPEASDAEVKKAWRQKTLEFHPDRVMGKGLSESFIEFADVQMKKVNRAYETIRKARGL
ncbi:MAG: TerB family tellurite resistance protein [Victivallaceae bacterium]|nr:TerB family tellurite resistance protein [Victivallaceae bacterium]